MTVTSENYRFRVRRSTLHLSSLHYGISIEYRELGLGTNTGKTRK